MNPITKAIRIQTERTGEMEHSTPMFLTSSFCFDDAEEMRAAFIQATRGVRAHPHPTEIPQSVLHVYSYDGPDPWGP